MNNIIDKKMMLPLNTLQKSLLQLLALLLFLWQGATHSFAMPQGTQILEKTDMQSMFNEIILERTSLPKGDLEITNFSCQPQRVSLPQGIISHKIISKTQSNHLGRVVAVVSILIDGYERAKVKLSGNVQLYSDVVVAARTIQRRKILLAEDLRVARQNITMLGPGHITDQQLAVGKELTTTLRPSAVIYARFLISPKLVKRGDVVSILAQTNSLRISVPGRVQDAGAQGDIIRVKNLMSRKEIYAKVISSDQVQVDF